MSIIRNALGRTYILHYTLQDEIYKNVIDK